MCEAVSTLFQSMVYSIEELTEDDIQTQIKPGNSYVKWEELTERGRLLVDSFLLGIEAVAEMYPDYIRVSEP